MYNLKWNYTSYTQQAGLIIKYQYAQSSNINKFMEKEETAAATTQ